MTTSTLPLPPALSRGRWRWPLLLVLGTLVGAAIPELLARGYYHYDDNMHLFLPTFYEIGTQLRMGHMPWISDRSWYGGNLIGEGQFALFNPFSLALYAWMSTMPQTAVAAFVFASFHLLVLAIGAYLLVVNLGGRQSFAAAAGIACANTSIVSYWYAAAWWNALVADAWMMMALGFWARFLLQGRGLLPAVIFGALSMVSGWPHGWLALGIFIAHFAFVAWGRGDRRRAAVMLGGGIATLLLALPAIAPVVDYALLSERRSGIANSGDMVGTLEALLAMSWPAYLPQVHRIYGYIAEAPLMFASWFAVPVLLACRRQLWSRRREPALALVMAAALTFCVLSLGPEYFLFVRWPMRFVSYYQIMLIVLAALLLSDEAARRDVAAARWPLAIYGAAMLYLSLSSDPHNPDRQGILVLVGILFLVGLPALARRASVPVAAAFLAVTTLAMTAVIHWQWPRHPNVPDWKGPAQVAPATGMRVPAFSGNVLLLHNWAGVPKNMMGAGLLIAAFESNADIPSGALALWSIPHTINGYSAVPQAGLKKNLCFNAWGHSCADVLKNLFETPADAPLRRDQLLNLVEIRVKKNRYNAKAASWPPEWQLAETTEHALVYRRVPPQAMRGSVVWADDELKLLPAGPAEMMREAIDVENPAGEPKRMLFARANYPGYTIALNGKPLPITVVDKTFISVSVPAKAAGRLELSYAPPLLRVLGPLALLALLATAGLARVGARDTAPAAGPLPGAPA